MMSLKQILTIFSICLVVHVGCKKKDDDDDGGAQPPVKPAVTPQGVAPNSTTPPAPSAKPPVTTTTNTNTTSGVLAVANQAIIGTWVKTNWGNNASDTVTFKISMNNFVVGIACDTGIKVSKEADVGGFKVDQTSFITATDFKLDATNGCIFNLTANGPRLYSVNGNQLSFEWGGVPVIFTRQ